MRTLIVIDMQNDFIYGSLGNEETRKIVPAVKEKCESYKNDLIIFTQDTHFDNYLNTLEGKKLPIPHCIYRTEGHKIIPELKEYAHRTILKETFGYNKWKTQFHNSNYPRTVEICGVCTDICLISNALDLRMLFPDMEIIVDARCCAGSTPEKHKSALDILKSCHIEVIE